MAVILQNLRETHQLGPKTREWLVSSQQVPGVGTARVRFSGFTEARDGYEFVRHNPGYSMILVCKAGEGLALIDGSWKPVRAGQAYVTAPRALHAYHIRPGCEWHLHWAIHEESIVLPTLEKGRKPRIISVDALGFQHAVEGFCYENAGKADQTVMGFWAALVDRMVLRFLESEMAEPRLDRLWQSVRMDINGAWSLRRMARLAGMGEENLRRICHRHTTRSPMAQLTRLRMLMAVDLLCYTQESIGTIAERVGYGDAFAFSTAFKREIGKSPRHYRNSSRPSSGT